MLRLLSILATIFWGGLAQADALDDLAAVANGLFSDLPGVTRVATLSGICRADARANDAAIYCTSRNVIFVVSPSSVSLTDLYRVAHLYGHAVQVRHGVADIALRTITANRGQEAELRRDVTRMVECIAGVILRGGGIENTDLTRLFASEPFTGSHWGREPLSVGPRVRIGLAERAAWLARGQAAGHPRACDTPSFSADLVVQAFRR